MTTRLTDIFLDDYYQTLDSIDSLEKTAFYESGIVTRSLYLDSIAVDGGTLTGRIWMRMKLLTPPMMILMLKVKLEK